MSRKGLAGAIIATFLIAGGLGWSIGYFMPELDIFKGSRTFNPTIDGSFDNAEGWQYADYQFIEYLTLDENSTNTNNYFYIHLTNDSLYILVDFCGDITGETDDEWFTIWIDTSTTELFGLDDTGWNSTVLDGGEQMLCFIPESETLNNTFSFYGNEFAATLNNTEVDISFGFQGTINSQTKHRIFEMEIKRDSFINFNSTSFNVGVLGYGTAAYYYYAEDGFWGAPSSFAEYFYIYNEIKEDRYFRCKGE